MKRIVLDTSSSGLEYLDIPHQVKIIPLHLTVNNVDFVDGKNITPNTLNAIIKNTPNTTAKTTPATEAEVLHTFYELYEQGYEEVFVCSLSSKISKSYDIFSKAKSVFSERMNIFIYDTRTLNIAEAALAYEADCLIHTQLSMPEIAKHLDALRDCSVLFFTLNDLKYIIQNKKLSAPSGFFANLFNIKPIMQVDFDGIINVYKKVRTIEQTLRQMIQIVDNIIGDQESFMYIADTGFTELTHTFQDILKHEYGITNIPVIPVSTISMANHGPEGMGFGAFYGNLPKIAHHFYP